ncbi:MAG TPA: hypothetical protein VHM28_12695, partial [Anaerolineales bacterium]|nr:hypothetical protein [Anaerolineales bacterium]
MDKTDLRLEILDQARRRLTEDDHLTPAESEDILRLLNVLIEVTERNIDPKESMDQTRQMAIELVNDQGLLFALRQQAD